MSKRCDGSGVLHDTPTIGATATCPGCVFCDRRLASARIRGLEDQIGETMRAHADANSRTRALEAENKRLMDIEVAYRSLLTELWDGVRIHKLNGNIGKRDGERLIHAYCGGIVEAMNKVETLEAEKRKLWVLARALRNPPKIMIWELVDRAIASGDVDAALKALGVAEGEGES